VDGVPPALTLVVALAVGILMQSAARHLRVPGIVLLLIAGAGLGPDGLAWITPRSLGDGLVAVVDLAVAVILFEGGLNLEISRLRREQTPIRRLVTSGAIITLVGAAVSAHLLLEWAWMQSLLFGGLVVVTGPTVVGPLVRRLRLRPRLVTVLEAEGVLIDPIGAILAVLLLGIALQGTDSISAAPTLLVTSLGFGAVAGGIAGLGLAAILRVRGFVPEGLENVFTLAAVLLVFQGCDAIVHHSGILAVTIAGVVVGNLRTRVDRDLREFKDQLTVLLIGLLFVLLAADVRIEQVLALGWGGIAVVAALVFVVRPLNVFASTIGSELSTRERLFAAWVAPRGIVAAAVASLTATALEQQGIPGGPELRAMVFLCITGTVVLAGLTAGPMATLLEVRLPGRDTVAILGAQGLGLELGIQLRTGGVPVMFIDSNPGHCRLAEEAGFQVVFGDALAERTLQRGRFDLVGSAIGLTPNQMLNSLFASRARQHHGVTRGYVAALNPDVGLAPELVEREEVVVLFDGPHDIERWEVRARHNELEVSHWVFGGPKYATFDQAETPELGAINERLVVLTIRRGQQVMPMHAGLKLDVGDVAAVAIHIDEREIAESLLEARGWTKYHEDSTGA
jgi:NhaP-type Na+/H+ or K+/H+ antiporter